MTKNTEIAKVIMEQIRYISPMAFADWGLGCSTSGYIYAIDVDKKPGLAIKPRGMVKHKGWIKIVLNEGSDTYEIYSYSTQNKLKEHKTNVYVDELCYNLDRIILGEDYAKKMKYRGFC